MQLKSAKGLMLLFEIDLSYQPQRHLRLFLSANQRFTRESLVGSLQLENVFTEQAQILYLRRGGGVVNAPASRS